jgi:type II secretory pathway pseudopilin PulG
MRSIHKFVANNRGLSIVELLFSIVLSAIVMAGTASVFLAGKSHARNQALEIETTQAARAAVDAIIRELRLGGACLPVTGQFMALAGVDAGTNDELTTRTGLTRGDLSCISSATVSILPAGTSQPIEVGGVDGFEIDMRAYIRHPNGTGEFFTVTSVDTTDNKLGHDVTFASDYPATSGIYAVLERSFFLDHWDFGRGLLPQLMVQTDAGAPHSFAVGIEQLDVQYVLNTGCPECDVVDLPADNAEWTQVERVLVSATARSDRTKPNGQYVRRTVSVGVKPRNLIAN